MSEYKLYLTGASGLLGRAVYTLFNEKGWHVFGTALTRVNNDLHKVDITNNTDLSESIRDYRPDIIIHTAAQRYPDSVDKDPEGAKKLNVETTKNLCNIAKEYNIPVVYISTDYVFDGKNAPYKFNDPPNPVNLYGKTKLEGEQETLKASENNICLRIPVIYGPIEKLSESAVTCLIEVLRNSHIQSKVSDYERRNPSHVNDIAKVCYQLSAAKVQAEEKLKNTIKGIYQWCGEEVLTKYQMIQLMSKTFRLPMDHIEPVKDSGGSSVIRPYDTRLDTSRLTALGFGQHTPFEEGIQDAYYSIF